MSLGWPEILLIALVVFLLFGAGKLPRLMGDMAEGVKAFKKGLKDDDKPAVQDKSDRDAT
jgi:sec-independent protein translocase protein TatA